MIQNLRVCLGEVNLMQNGSESGQRAAFPQWYCCEHQCEMTYSATAICCPKGHVFPVRDDIPRFVDSPSYAAHFGEQWRRYRRTQLDSYTGKPISRVRLQRCFGNLWPELCGSQILECGCGAGRFTEVLLSEGASVTSIDLSEAVDVNVEMFPLGDAHRAAQADIFSLPFAPGRFDFVVCLGVIQHTPSPERTIAKLFEQVRPGGWLILDHYTYEIGWYTKSAPLFRSILKRMPTDRSLRVTEALVNAALPVHRAVANKRLLRAVFSRISPVLSHYVTYPELPDDLQRQWALLDTHDSLTDWYKHFRTRGQVHRILANLGAENVEAVYAGNGVEARAKRPSNRASGLSAIQPIA